MILAESVNEGWNNSFPLTGTRPQPEFSVGFRREAFTDEQLGKLAPFIGNFISGDQSYFMATYYMYFPFLTYESMTLAVRATVELFRLIGREMELHQEILVFSISHDHRSVRIYGHYPAIDGKDTKYYRHPIHEFSFTALDGKEKWTAYKFTKNVYETWISAFHNFPKVLGFQKTFSAMIFRDRASLILNHKETVSKVLAAAQGTSTPNTSFTGRGAPKRPRKRLAEGQ
ncbi:hypothetical protein EPUS_09300 [Endocarpon pusillum Z07020]|uniref:DUF7924 domain-containing protein n=1 Tax=Endocarpon pusillum (strain Z07020 / HMAS-L-300199) TaxID=1263415 RepID=U1GHT6_ENDPU|nr:uncharacterized protein EPUS_09300 [Endocarpon pusillum Z07020]ERF71376.1 hypothetical protein EPUS_09300 [Endocarpon pusillum Z07020]